MPEGSFPVGETDDDIAPEDAAVRVTGNGDARAPDIRMGTGIRTGEPAVLALQIMCTPRKSFCSWVRWVRLISLYTDTRNRDNQTVSIFR